VTTAPEAGTRLEKLMHPEATRVRAAANRCSKLFPPPVAAVLYTELMVWAEFGYRLDKSGTIARLVDHVLTTPIPRRDDECVTESP
jgi:hypothetical protein